MPQHLDWNWQLQRTCTLGMMSTCGYSNYPQFLSHSCCAWCRTQISAFFGVVALCLHLWIRSNQMNVQVLRWGFKRCPYNFGARWATGKLPSYFLKHWGPWAATSAGHRHGKCKIEGSLREQNGSTWGLLSFLFFSDQLFYYPSPSTRVSKEIEIN